MFSNEKKLVFSLFFEADLSVEEISILTGISRPTLYRVKNHGDMSPKTFMKLYKTPLNFNILSPLIVYKTFMKFYKIPGELIKVL